MNARVLGGVLLLLGVAAATAGPLAGQAARQPPTADERAEAERRLAAELRAPTPIPTRHSVWSEELTWMEIRDALAAGTRTIIVSTGGVEQNGPYTVTGKHNVILRGQCESLARRLGNALCAPIVAFVPEGSIEPRTGHMRYPGTISVKETTFRALLDDIASSYAANGFTEVILIGDSGGNQSGLRATADVLNARWQGKGSVARYIPEFYDNDAVVARMKELGVVEPKDDGLHDYYWATALIMAVDPASARYDERVRAGRATINGVSIAPMERTVALGLQLVDFRTEHTVRAIEKARAGR